MQLPLSLCISFGPSVAAVDLLGKDLYAFFLPTHCFGLEGLVTNFYLCYIIYVHGSWYLLPVLPRLTVLLTCNFDTSDSGWKL